MPPYRLRPPPRRSYPPPPFEGDGSHERGELDWGCLAIVIALVATVVVIAMLLVAASFPTEGPYSSALFR